jgi:mRNA interferase MazF
MRGDIVAVATQGDFGKPRPAVVIQANQFVKHPSITVLPLTSTLVAAPLIRVTVEPDGENGLEKTSQIMVDKAVTIRRDKLKQPIGRLDPDTLVQVERCLVVFLGIAQ